MTLAQYAKQSGMSLAQYETLEAIVTDKADDIFEQAEALHPTGTGVYYPVTELDGLRTGTIGDDLIPFVITKLKSRKYGMEFYDNNSMWRV